MAGLLDNMVGTSIDDPRTAATAAMVQGLLGGQGFAGGMSAGLLGYQDQMAKAKRRQQEEQLQKFHLDQLQRTIAQQAAQDKFRASIPSPMMQASQQAMAGGGGPTQANAAQMRPADPMAQFMHQAMQAGEMTPLQYMQAQQKAVPKFSTEVRYDQTGRAFVVAENGEIKFLDGVKSRDKLVADNLGGKLSYRTEFDANPVAQQAMTQTPDGAAANSLGRARLALDRESAGGYEYKTDAAGNLIALPKKPKLAGPIQGIPVTGLSAPGQKDANEALSIIAQARDLIPKATGSGIGALTDSAAGFFGKSSESGDNAAKLQALEGALVAKMPKMSGPQSDKDVAMYKQMAAEIGNPWTPASRRMAALQEVERIQQRYAGQQAAPQQPAQPNGGLKFLGFEGGN